MEIATLKSGNCIIHICDDAIVNSKEKQDEIWKRFSQIAYQLCKNTQNEGVKNKWINY